MRCRRKPAGTWYDLIRTCLEEDAARTALSGTQVQVLLSRLEEAHIIAKPPAQGEGAAR